MATVSTLFPFNMNSSLKLACLMVVFATCLCQSEAFVIPKNETEGGPCRNFTIQNILDITEELRIRMHLPIDRFNIPVLHPLFVEQINLDDFDILAGLDIQMNNVSFLGFRDFIINDLDFNLIGFNLSLQLVVPLLQISGQHVSNGSLYGLVPVVGSGPVNLNVSDLVFEIDGQLSHIGAGWNVSRIDVDFTISGISGAFENLSDPFLNDLLNLSGREILELGWPGLKPSVEEIIVQAVIDFLDDFTIEELMGMLFGAGIDWSEVDDLTTTTTTTTAAPLPFPFLNN